jgi:hypothetical protein
MRGSVQPGVEMPEHLVAMRTTARRRGCGHSPAFLAFCRSIEERLISCDQSSTGDLASCTMPLAKTVPPVPGRVRTPKTQQALPLKRTAARRNRRDGVGCRAPVLHRTRCGRRIAAAPTPAQRTSGHPGPDLTPSTSDPRNPLATCMESGTRRMPRRWQIAGETPRIF